MKAHVAFRRATDNLQRMNVPDLRRSLGAILAAEERQPPDWHEAERLADDLLRQLAAEPNTQCPEIANRFLDDMDIRAKDDGYAEFQRTDIRRFVERGDYSDSKPVPWWASALVAIVVIGVLLWSLL